jgi:hypothetical protein
MVDLAEIQAAYYMVAATGVLVAAFYYVYNMRTNQRMMKATQDSRKAEVTNNILRNLLSLDSWKAFFDVMNLEWKDFEDFTKKYDSLVSPDLAAKRLFYLSTLENVGYLLKMKIIDAETVYEVGGIQAVWFYTKMKPVIEGYRKISWGRERFKNVDYLAGEMYRMILERDPSFKGDQFYFDSDDMATAFAK